MVSSISFSCMGKTPNQRCRARTHGSSLHHHNPKKNQTPHSQYLEERGNYALLLKLGGSLVSTYLHVEPSHYRKKTCKSDLLCCPPPPQVKPEQKTWKLGFGVKIRSCAVSLAGGGGGGVGGGGQQRLTFFFRLRNLTRTGEKLWNWDLRS